MTRRRARSSAAGHDVVFYIPTISSLLAETTEPGSGGAETQVFLLSRALAARGVRVAVIANELPDGLPRHYGGVDVFGRPSNQGRKGLLGKAAEIAQIWRSLAAVNAPVIVRRIAGADVAAIGAFARLRRRRFVYSSAALLDFDLDQLPVNCLERTLFRFGLRLAHNVVVQTEEQARLCEREIGRRPMLIKSIAEPAPELDTPDVGETGPEAFLWVGRVCSYKRPLAFVELARAIPEARFRMVALLPTRHGETEDQTLWGRLQAAGRETGNLEILRPMSRGQLRLLIRRAVAVVNTTDSEGMPNVFLEGWLEGVPALALAHDPGGVIATHRLGGFAAGSKERFVQLARDMWCERDDRARLAKNCRDYVHWEHSPENVVAQWAALIAESARNPMLVQR